MVVFGCHECHSFLETPESCAGKIQDCPECGAENLVPTRGLRQVFGFLRAGWREFCEGVKKSSRDAGLELGRCAPLEAAFYLLYRIDMALYIAQVPPLLRRQTCWACTILTCIRELGSTPKREQIERLSWLAEARLGEYAKRAAHAQDDTEGIRQTHKMLVNYLLASPNDFEDMQRDVPIVITGFFQSFRLQIALKAFELHLVFPLCSVIGRLFHDHKKLLEMNASEVDSRVEQAWASARAAIKRADGH